MHTLDQQMAGLATLLTRRTDELIAAVNGSAADPVRALSALTGQLRSEVADSSEALRNVAADVTQRSAETIEALLKRLTEQVEASSVSLSETVTRSAENSVELPLRDRRPVAPRIDIRDRQPRSNQRRHRPGDRIGREIDSRPFKAGSRRASRNSSMRSAASLRRSLLWDGFLPRPSPTPARLPGNSPSMRKLSQLSDGILRSSSSRSTPPSSAAAAASKRSSAISRAAARPSRRRSGGSRPTSKTVSPGRKLAPRKSAPRSPPPRGARRLRSRVSLKPFATRRQRSATERPRRCRRPSNRPTRS